MFKIYGACYREEFASMTVTDIDDRDFVIMTVSKLKMNKKHVLATLGFYKRHIMLCPINVPYRLCFLQERENALVIQLVGNKTFGNISKIIATFFLLLNSEKYIIPIFRRTSANLLTDNLYYFHWKTTSVAESCLEIPLNRKI